MAVLGVDLGVRSLYLAILEDNGSSIHYELILTMPKGIKVGSQSGRARGTELRLMADFIAERVVPGDVVFVEEPPMAGSRNIKTFAALSQSCGTVLMACARTGVDVHPVPVDGWKIGLFGKGGLGKDEVTSRLTQIAPQIVEQCDGNQNRIDASAIALFGQEWLTQEVDPELALCKPGHRQLGPRRVRSRSRTAGAKSSPLRVG